MDNSCTIEISLSFESSFTIISKPSFLEILSLVSWPTTEPTAVPTTAPTSWVVWSSSPPILEPTIAPRIEPKIFPLSLSPSIVTFLIETIVPDWTYWLLPAASLETTSGEKPPVAQPPRAKIEIRIIDYIFLFILIWPHQ